jgi:hypothetical protein
MTWTSARRPPAGTMVAAAHRAARRLPRPSPRTATATWGPPPPPAEAGEAEPSIRARRVARTAAPEEERRWLTGWRGQPSCCSCGGWSCGEATAVGFNGGLQLQSLRL